MARNRIPVFHPYALWLLACAAILLLDGCDFHVCGLAQGSFSSFHIRKDVPDFNLAVGDSVIIDMSDYWEGTTGCQELPYTPQVLWATTDPRILDVDAVEHYLILRAKTPGVSSARVEAQQEGDNDSCLITRSRSRQYIDFFVTTTGGTSRQFEEEIEGGTSIWPAAVTIEPEQFVVGDTLTLRVLAADSSVISLGSADYYWVIDNARLLGGDYRPCINEITVSRMNEIRLVVQDTSLRIEGFVMIDSISDDGRTVGLMFIIEPPGGSGPAF